MQVKLKPESRSATASSNVAAAKIDRARNDGRFDVSVVAGYMRMDTGFPQRGFGPDGSLGPIGTVSHVVAGGAMVMLVYLWLSLARAEVMKKVVLTPKPK